MESNAQENAIERFYWEELSPVEGCPINVFNVRDEKTLTEMHSHTYMEIALVVSGVGTYCTPTEEFPIKRGDVFLLGPEHCHSYSRQENLVVYNLVLRDSSVLHQNIELAQEPALRYFFELEPHFRSSDRFQRHLQLNNEQIETLARIMEEMKSELVEQGAHFKNMLNLLLKQFLILLCRYYTSAIDVQNDNLFALANVLQYMERQMSSRITCDDLARHVHMTPKTFYRFFKSITGKAPIDYLLELRLDSARKLLASTSMTIKEIADQCGFCSPSYLGQQFRKKYGKSPNQHRYQTKD